MFVCFRTPPRTPSKKRTKKQMQALGKLGAASRKSKASPAAPPTSVTPKKPKVLVRAKRGLSLATPSKFKLCPPCIFLTNYPLDRQDAKALEQKLSAANDEIVQLKSDNAALVAENETLVQKVSELEAQLQQSRLNAAEKHIADTAVE